MNDSKFTLDNVKMFTSNAASENGWAVTPDSEFRLLIEEGLFENYKRYGYLLCPCREAWGERSRDRDIICPCEYSSDDIREYGHCYCGLFMSGAFCASGGTAGSIPERRAKDLIPE